MDIGISRGNWPGIEADGSEQFLQTSLQTYNLKTKPGIFAYLSQFTAPEEDLNSYHIIL